MATSLRIDIAWTNTSQAAQVLNNPNAQISIGIYRHFGFEGGLLTQPQKMAVVSSSIAANI